jgi:hypothetical protein
MEKNIKHSKICMQEILNSPHNKRFKRMMTTIIRRVTMRMKSMKIRSNRMVMLSKRKAVSNR